MIEPHFCVAFSINDLREHYLSTGCEFARRVLRLYWGPRKMSVRAARITVSGAMYGIGCVEGEIRAAIEAQKKKPTSEEMGR